MISDEHGIDPYGAYNGDSDLQLGKLTVPSLRNELKNVSMFTITRRLVGNMYQGRCWLILNLEPWTQLDRDLMVELSAQTTSFLASPEQETTGQKDITQKEPS